uniref:Eukaryotic translation initiation factor 4E-4 (inferred by orthology to a C. elegans protein) n=1 Tax=Strongyloides venezuelensis TaxID=75913 RepID=A0A0K0FNS9_STRVS
MVAANCSSTGSSVMSSWENEDFCSNIHQNGKIDDQEIHHQSIPNNNTLVVPDSEPQPSDHLLAHEFLLSSFVKTPEVEWDNYEHLTTPIAIFRSWEQFWRVILHFQRPTEIQARCYIHVFKDGIKPLWEDPGNILGGRFMMTYKKKDPIADLHWEKMLLAFLGSNFHDSLISGIVLSVKRNNLVISVWINDFNKREKLNNLVFDLKTYLDLDDETRIRFMKHKEDTFVHC